MSLTDLLPSLQALPREDKLRVVQFLVNDLAREEGIEFIEAEAAYPVWTPYNAFDAAATLLKVLEEERTRPDAPA